ncbi:hypothetical protein D3C86_2044770 [compost metagenome]
MSVLKYINSRIYSGKVNYNIYTPSNGLYTPYSEESYLPDLKEIIITAPRIKR